MATDIRQRGYANPDTLVSTAWVAEHLKDPGIRLVESNEDTLLYASGHIPGAVHVDWTSDLNDPLRRDYISRTGFEQLMSRIGVTPETTVVFYGDKNNWWACYACWVFQLFGHTKARIMDGGRLKWEQEGRPLTRDVPSIAKTTYRAPERDDSSVRAFRDDVLMHVREGTAARRRPFARGVHGRNGCTCRTTRTRERSAADTSPARGTFRGPARSTRKTVRSRRRTSSGRSTSRNRASPPTTTSSPTAASASGAAIRGSS